MRPFVYLIPIALLFSACNSPSKESPEAVSPGLVQPETRDLLASENLDDWNYVLADPEVSKEAVWSFNSDGHLVCQGAPKGFLATKGAYTDFKLVVEWRWPDEPSNSGVLIRIQSEHPIPTSLEAQLKSGSAGNLMGLRGAVLSGPDLRVREHPTIERLHILPKQAGEEKPLGQWNRYEIMAAGDEIRVFLNGQLANKATGAEVVAGPIGFQSEGGVIEFRKIELTVLN